ncbi:hypothetical protein [Brevundimonas sp. AAP58]|nr:hypothetical protein [Brevundimonas sp. AAP58]
MRFDHYLTDIFNQAVGLAWRETNQDTRTLITEPPALPRSPKSPSTPSC